MNLVKRKIIAFINKIKIGEKIIDDHCFIETNKLNQLEISKKTRRTEIINFLVSITDAENYLEIGVRNQELSLMRILWILN
jgi:predicted O-methyltransferase YrrM